MPTYLAKRLAGATVRGEMDVAIQTRTNPLRNICQRRVVKTYPKGVNTECGFADGTSILVSNFLSSFIRTGCELCFPLELAAVSRGTEIYVRNTNPEAGRREDVFQAEIGYATQPREDKRKNLFISAEVVSGRLGISAIHMRCEALRDYFYVGNRRRNWDRQPSLYELLRVNHNVSPTELRLAFKLRALELRGEVILPSYTFVATAHALQWQEITPVFADIDPDTLNLDPGCLERLITPRTTGIIGVHVWGRPCNTEAIGEIARKHGLKVMYDAAHAFGCSHQGKMIGNFGECEVLSFHATKFINSFEGGAILTNNDALAEKIRLMRNFGFAGFDRVIYLGTNGKMTEVCAAMGLTSLESMDEIIRLNRYNYEEYKAQLQGIPGITPIDYSSDETRNYHYIVVQVDASLSPLDRDELVEVLHAENILARKYFWPGCHRMEPYKALFPNAYLLLPHTEARAAQMMVLPTGQSVSKNDIAGICSIIKTALAQADQLKPILKQKLSR